jgi:hypothetical protein
MFKWFKSLTPMSKSVKFSLQVMQLFEKYEISDDTTRDAVIDTIVNVLQQHKTPVTPAQGT